MDKERNDLATVEVTENTEFQYGEYKVTTVFTDNGISILEKLGYHFTKTSNGFFTNEEPIPYNKQQIINTSIYHQFCVFACKFNIVYLIVRF